MRDEDFQTDQLVDMLYQILMYRFPSRKFIFLSHSMGTHISIKLVNRLSEGKSYQTNGIEQKDVPGSILVYAWVV
ncbi:hypothetical protein JL09_g6602 [Pichia kudriavzevii]|uniref:Uncharacterized protein n=1 Tax=Pichia kudriavzevii TaxID=4909 RepID=A0A099NPI3_PICKU|nr:hypothetical protein JL09_g6602 [Pichia kudriavzevii]